MYARKIRSVFDRLLPNRKKNYTKIKTNYKYRIKKGIKSSLGTIGLENVFGMMVL